MIEREVVSTIRSSHKILSNDSLLNDRSILSEAKIARNILVKRETNLRKLWATDTLFTPIPCLEMEEVPISSCCAYEDPCTVSRSKFKLPRIAEGNYQYIVQGVWSINIMGGKGKKFTPTTINRYINTLKLPIVKNDLYWWIVDDYLYTNDPLLKSLRISAFFEEDIPNEIMFPDCDCETNKYSDSELCKNPLDDDFALPGYLEKQLIDLVSQRLLSTYFRLKSDLATTNIDGQAPNVPPSE